MQIDVSQLLKAVGNSATVEGEEKCSFPDDGIELVKPVKVKARLVNAGEEILLTGKLEVVARMECGRCLKQFEQPLKVEIEEHFRTEEGRKTAKELELAEDDFVFPLEEGHYVPMDEVIRQAVLTAWPLAPLCNDCKKE